MYDRTGYETLTRGELDRLLADPATPETVRWACSGELAHRTVAHPDTIKAHGHDTVP